jgi:carbonic anhydrase/acetyltransferase-like protein (isoleucine patch superfamily)
MPGLILPFRNHTPTIAPEAWIADNATLIGDVVVGARANIWFGCVLRGDITAIHVGENANIQDGTIVHVATGKPPTHIGANVTIGHMALIHACHLEDFSFVGMKACILDGAVVETGAWVAAGAVVTPGKRVKSGELWAGTPARFLRPVSEQEARYIRELPDRYYELATQYRR